MLRCIKVLLLLYLLFRAGHCADWRANGAGPVCAVPDEQPDVATSNVRGPSRGRWATASASPRD